MAELGQRESQLQQESLEVPGREQAQLPMDSRDGEKELPPPPNPRVRRAEKQQEQNWSARLLMRQQPDLL